MTTGRNDDFRETAAELAADRFHVRDPVMGWFAVEPRDMDESDLREELRARGCPVGGSKLALVQRLRDALVSVPDLEYDKLCGGDNRVGKSGAPAVSGFLPEPFPEGEVPQMGDKVMLRKGIEEKNGLWKGEVGTIT